VVCQGIRTKKLALGVVSHRSLQVETADDVAAILRRAQKPLLLAVNKLDHLEHEPHTAEFYALGIEPLLPISAEHGRGVGELLDAMVERLPNTEATAASEPAIRVAVVGRPNVGKSTLINALLGTPRLIVSPVPGTTRDAVDTLVTWGTQRFVLIDTAGVRRKARIEARLEWRSVARSLHGIRRCQTALLVLDAQEGLTDQDARLANYIHRMGKASLVLVNKADLLHGAGPQSPLAARETAIRQHLGSLGYSPILFISALTGQRVDRLFPTIQTIIQAYQRRLPTSAINDCLQHAWSRRPPRDRRGRELKLFYATQIGVEPPTFIGFVNHPEGLSTAFVRYLERQMREKFGFEGSPLKILFRARHHP
jgi:GTP-binding protein